MQQTSVNKIKRIEKNKEKLEKALNLQIEYKNNNVLLKGKAEDEFIGLQVIDALDLGFPFTEAINMKKENKILERINIKKYAKQSNLEKVRGRIIGKNGKALKTLSNLTDSAIELQENTVAVITQAENLQRVTQAIIAIIKGAKHGAVYKELEHNFPKQEYDLGLKEHPVKTMEEFEEEISKQD